MTLVDADTIAIADAVSRIGAERNRLLNDVHRLTAEVERLQSEMNDWREGDLRGVVAHMHAFKDRSDKAEAEVEKLRKVVEYGIDALTPRAQFLENADADDLAEEAHDTVILLKEFLKRARAALEQP